MNLPAVLFSGWHDQLIVLEIDTAHPRFYLTVHRVGDHKGSLQHFAVVFDGIERLSLMCLSRVCCSRQTPSCAPYA